MPGQPHRSAVNDYEELQGLMQRYARAVDDRDIPALGLLFHPDAEISGSSRGALSLGEWLDAMRAPRAFPQSMHMIGCPLVEIREDGSEADLDTYAVVHQLSDPKSDANDLTLGIRYLDEAVVHEGRWVLKKRVANTLWMR
jgi:hypothetical protein